MSVTSWCESPHFSSFSLRLASDVTVGGSATAAGADTAPAMADRMMLTPSPNAAAVLRFMACAPRFAGMFQPRRVQTVAQIVARDGGQSGRFSSGTARPADPPL